MNVVRALGYGLLNVFHPRMLWLMVWPMLIAVVLWGTAAFFFWTRLSVPLTDVLKGWLDLALGWLPFDLGTLAAFIANSMLVMLFFALVYLTVLFILGAFGMQKMVNYVATQSFPGLERRRGGGTASSVGNAIVALGGMSAMFVVTLPLWLVPPLGPMVLLAILSWANQRLLRHDALAEHADAAEMARIFRERRGALYLMGFLLALFAYVPLVQFLGPVVFGLAFIRYLLGALEELRAITVPYGSHPNKELVAGNTGP
jgi:CysZ protein